MASLASGKLLDVWNAVASVVCGAMPFALVGYAADSAGRPQVVVRAARPICGSSAVRGEAK